jgi:secreted trypsin-like serine protease
MAIRKTLALAGIAVLMAAGLVTSTETAQAIIGGTIVTDGQAYPYTVFVQTYFPNAAGGTDHCTGTLIASQWVLSAGHCFSNKSTGADVYLKTLDLTKLSQGVVIKADRWWVDPAYSGGNTHDLSLIHLSRPVTDIAPIALATPADLRLAKTQPSFDVVGWGRMFEEQKNKCANPLSNDLRLAKVTFFKTSSGLIETKSLPGQNSGPLEGDSGGPLIARNAAGVAIEIGNTTAGDHSGTCSKTVLKDAIYADLSDKNIVGWIQKRIGATDAPSPVLLKADANGSLAASWTRPLSTNAVAPVDSYTLVLSRDGADLPPVTVPSSSTDYTFPSVAAGGRAYTVYVSAHNKYGSSNYAYARLQVGSPLAIVTTSLPNVHAGDTVSVQLSASGGQAPYSWSSGLLPAGLSLSSDGKLTGVVTNAGSFSITFSVTDGLGSSISSTLQLNSTSGPLTITPGILTVDLCHFTYPTLAASGGTLPYTWSSPNLPPGFTLAPSGYLTYAGTQSGALAPIPVQVTDGAGTTVTGTATVGVELCL